MTAYYNEWEAYPAQWLRNLVDAGHIARGVVDERSITEVTAADDLASSDQCHFFAGIAGWSYALRLAGWPDDLPVWTASCPCQPFSSAGRRAGVEDERHLWPVLAELVRQCHPPILFGEQVAGPDGRAWFDVVSADLERSGYAVGAANLCAAGVGGPHIRQRLYFVAVADADHESLRERLHVLTRGSRQEVPDADRGGEVGGVANRLGIGQQGVEQDRAAAPAVERGCAAGAGTSDGGRVANSDDVGCGTGRAGIQDGDGSIESSRRSAPVGMGHPRGHRDRQHPRELPRHEGEHEVGGAHGNHAPVVAGPALPGPWSDAEWIHCSDGKARPAQPGSYPLAHGVPARVGKLRALGNAVVTETTATFIRAVMESL